MTVSGLTSLLIVQVMGCEEDDLTFSTVPCQDQQRPSACQVQLFGSTREFLGWKPALQLLYEAQEYEVWERYQQQMASHLTLHFVHLLSWKTGQQLPPHLSTCHFETRC